MGAAAYGGAIVYAVNDKQFNDAFTTYVPGGEQAVDFVQDLLKNNEIGNFGNQTPQWKQQAEEYASKAKEYGKQAKDRANDAYEYAADTYYKLTGQKQPPKLQQAPEPTKKDDEKPPSLVVTEKTDKKAGEISLSTEKSGNAPVVSVAIEKPEPIVVKRINTDSPVIRNLSQVLVELAAILNDAGMSGKGREIMKEAENQLQALNIGYKEDISNYQLVLKDVAQLQQKSEKIHAALDKYHEDAQQVIQTSHAQTAKKVQAKEAELLKEFEDARQEMKKTFEQLMAQEIDAQKAELEHERSQALLKQSEDMQRKYIREVRLLVERERAGRLSKLDQIDKRFKALEQQSLQNASVLDRSRATHLMHITFGAFQDAISGVHKRPFVQELEAFRSSAKDDVLLQTVLDTIPVDVAENGVDTIGDLKTRFEHVAKEVRSVALVPEDGGFGSHIISWILAKIMFKKEGLVEGDDVEAVLARSNYYLKRGDLENAARELNQLKGWPKRLAEDWIVAARRHLEVKQALEVRSQNGWHSFLSQLSILTCR